MIKLFKNVITGVVVVVVLAIAALICTAWGGDSNWFRSEDKMTVTVQELRTELKEISDLSTYEGKYTTSFSTEEARKVLGGVEVPFSKNKIEISAEGVVKVGYDFSEIGIDVEDSTIYISLPEPQVNDNYLIWDTVECDETNNILNPIEFEQYKTIIAGMEKKGLESAEGKGIYASAEENIKNIISLFLAKFEGYEVVFR